MRKFSLSERMAAVAALVPQGTIVCDVGCDHGFVAIYLVREGICPKVIAVDIHRGPLLRAREHIRQAGLSAQIDTRLSDGLRALKAGEADCMVAAGMGGRLIVKIMEDGLGRIREMRSLILQPQSEIAFVRKFLREQGFLIVKEDMVFEDGKFYPMMLAETGGRISKGGAEENQAGFVRNREADFKEAPEAGEEIGADGIESLQDEFGPCLIRDKNAVLLAYLDWKERQQRKILKEVLQIPDRKLQVEQEIGRIQKVRGYMCGGCYEML